MEGRPRNSEGPPEPRRITFPPGGGEGRCAMSKKKQEKVGKRGENAAARYLELKGYKILDRNWSCPAGDVDIVAREGETLVFVTVQTLTDIDRGFPSEGISPSVRSRNEKIAAYYLSEFRDVDFPVRFDIVSLLVVAEDRALMRHYVNALGNGCC